MSEKFTGLSFDATQVAPDAGRQDPIPAGWYDARITDSELKPTANGSGTRLSLKFSIMGGQFNDRVVFEGLNIRNQNPKAQEIAQGQFSAILHAIGILTIQDTQQVHNVPLKIRVKIVPADGQYDAKNEITAYKNINEVVTMAGAPQAVAGAPAMPAMGAMPTMPVMPAGMMPNQPAQVAQMQPAQPWAQPAQAAQPAQMVQAATVAPQQAQTPVQATAAPATAEIAQPVQMQQPAQVAQTVGVVPPWAQPAAQVQPQ